MNDLRHAFRQLTKSPGFTVLAVLSLAVGIGINTTIFSAMDAAFLRPLAIGQPEEIVRVDWPGVSFLHYEQLRQQTHTLAGLAAIGKAGGVLRDEHGTELLVAETVSANAFSVLGVRPALGRLFQEAAAPDDAAGLVISHALWQRRYHGDPAIIGRTVALTEQPRTVIGVTAPGFAGTRRIPPADLWLLASASGRGRDRYSLIGRLRPGQGVAAARAELEALIPRVMPDVKPARPGNPPVSVFSEYESTMDHGGRLPYLLMPVVGLVLLVACLNVSSLLLARNEERKRELAVRLALGARRWDLLRQSLVENSLVAFLGTAAALLVTAWTITLLPALIPSGMFRAIPELALDRRTLAYGIGSATATLLLIGLVPAWRITRANLSPVLQGNDVPLGQSLRWWSGRNVIVAGQLVVAVVFLALAVLLMRAFFSGKQQELGFTPRDLLLVTLAPEMHGLRGPAARDYYDRLAERVRRVPGAKAVTFAHHLPLARDGTGYSVRAHLPDEIDATAGGRSIRANIVGPDFFAVLGIRLVRGRGFTAGDNETAGRVVVISETLARQFWPGADPVGRSLVLVDRGGQPYQIIGVARDVMDRQIGAAPEPYLYLSFAQERPGGSTLIVEATHGSAAVLAAPVRRAMREVDERVLPFGVETMANLLRFALLPQWLGAWLAGTLGLLAFLLSLSGLYGVVAYSVTRRTREIGIRMALGATQADALRGVFAHGLRLLAPGLALGLPLAVASGFLLRSLLQGVSPLDPVTLAGVSVLAAIVVLLASYFPARRAARVNPIEALRAE